MDRKRVPASLCPFALIGLITVACVVPSPAAAEEKLVAPAYPGAFRISPPAVKSMEGVVFLVKDSHEKVQGFYVPKYARLPKEGEGRTRGSSVIPLIAQSEETVTKIITSKKGDYTWARATEVIVQWQDPMPQGVTLDWKFFSKLQVQAHQHPGHDAELAELQKRYGWLRSAFFIEEKVTPILGRCSLEAGESAAANDPKAAKEAADQMMKLAKEGRYQEMAKLQQQSFGGDPAKAKADNFGLWKKCLDEAAGFAYLTKVTIDQDPNDWDVRWRK